MCVALGDSGGLVGSFFVDFMVCLLMFLLIFVDFEKYHVKANFDFELLVEAKHQLWVQQKTSHHTKLSITMCF